MGALTYADDLALLAPTAQPMRKLLYICREYGNKFPITFNATKSAWLYFGKTRKWCGRERQSCVGDEVISRVSQYTHLGHIVSADLDDKCQLSSKRNSLCGKINNVLCYFSKQDPVVKQKLLWSYCTDFYGSGLWDLTHPYVADVCIAWRKGLKRVWELPFRTHSAIVAPLCGMSPVRLELARRCAAFIVKCLYSSNDVVRSVATHGVYVRRMRSPPGVTPCTVQLCI